MKNLLLAISVGIVASWGLLSCDNSMEMVESSNIQTKTMNERMINSVNFIYKGKVYFSECEIIGDSIHILDGDVREISNHLAQLPQLASLVGEDGIIEYFDNAQVLEQCLAMRPTPYSTNYTTFELKGISVTLYDDVNYKDRSFQFSAPFAIPQLKDKPYEFNDKMSSFKMEGVIGLNNVRVDHTNEYLLTFWEDDNYQNHSIWFRVTNDMGLDLIPKRSWLVPSMKDYPLYPGSGKNWNDKTTSVALVNNIRYY